MRVNPNITPDILAAITQTQQQEQTALTQMSTGKRVNVPSDDPVASAREVENQTQTSAVDQYTSNVTTVLSMVQTADSALSGVVTQLTQAVTLGTEAATGTTNSENQQAILQQVQGIVQSVAASANTSFHGVYLFSGTESTTVPFTVDASDPTGYKYNGNSNTNEVGVGEGLSVIMNVPGSQLFQGPTTATSVLGSLQGLVTALQSGNSTDIGNATTAISTAISNLGQQRVIYGNSESQLTSQQTALQQESTNLATEENSLIGVDMASVTLQFAQAQLANQAALAAAARVLPQSLLDYLK